ncbi:Acg family FMN-binding oxidoreductase [Phytohabitans aurantiacus]|uniref:NAD(P)H nitroreductase n=1 Tax=Phytohabitans aurantiacus TaxID=3016789 RepID=A0ABQ5R1H4_9ACTN|nr:nitroreductase [Phytohabitans aurantiacus]GLH99711.1 hypothetical protein Pa4123_49870 [Phytohabitans aurantiacus]
MRARTHTITAPSVDVIAECVHAAVQAPSIHNTQPWRFEAHGRDIDVYADRSRQLSVLDPSGRQLLMSVGAAVFNLRLALFVHGRMPVQRLLPDPARPDLVARVSAGPTTVAASTAQILAAAIPHRHTNRFPFQPAAIPWPVLDELIGAATAEGATLNHAEPVVRDAILAVTRTADDRFRARTDYQAELAAWTSTAPDRRDGVPADVCGPTDLAYRLPLREFCPPVHQATFERHPALMILATRGDTPYHWLRAGEALQRVLLTATARRLDASPLNQALEIPGLRRLVTDQSAGRYAQTILRMGYGGPVPATPRRPLAEVLQTGGSPP